MSFCVFSLTLMPLLCVFCSSSPVCEAACQHLCPWVHGHCFWVWGLRNPSPHSQVGQEWRCCHPQWLLQNNCKLILHKGSAYSWTRYISGSHCLVVVDNSIVPWWHDWLNKWLCIIFVLPTLYTATLIYPRIHRTVVTFVASVQFH